jgi:hypothetical protein
MFAYIATISLVWFSAFCEVVNLKNSKVVLYISLVYVFIFVSLRYETGYDWIAYKYLFQGVDAFSFERWQDYSLTSIKHSKELAFILLNAVLKVFIDDFQILVFFASSLYFISILCLLKKITSKPAFVFAIIFSFLIFSVYFSVIRQSISIAFFNFFLVAYFHRKFVYCFFLALASILIQYSAFIYFIVFSLSDRLPRKACLYMMLVAMFLVSFSMGTMVNFIAELTSSLELGWVGKKLVYYLSERQLDVRLSDKVFMYGLVFIFFPVLVNFYSKVNGFWKKLCGMGILLSFAEILFIDHTVFRYRLFYAIFPIQVAIATMLVLQQPKLFRIIVFIFSFVLSVSYSSLFLLKDNALPFIPYQFWPTHYFYNDEGTGAERINAIK